MYVQLPPFHYWGSQPCEAYLAPHKSNSPAIPLHFATCNLQPARCVGRATTTRTKDRIHDRSTAPVQGTSDRPARSTYPFISLDFPICSTRYDAGCLWGACLCLQDYTGTQHSSEALPPLQTFPHKHPCPRYGPHSEMYALEYALREYP